MMNLLFFSYYKNLAKKATKQGFWHLLSANYATQFLGFCSLLIVTKLLDPSEVGAFKIMQSYVDVAIAVSTLGLTSSVLKFCSEVDVDKEYILKKSLIYGFYGALLAIVVLYVLVNLNVISRDEIVKIWILPYSFIIIPSIGTNIEISFFQAIKNFKKISKNQFILKIISVTVIVLATCKYGFDGYVMALIGTMYITFFALFAELSGKGFVYSTGNIPFGFKKLSLISMAATAVGVISNYIDIFLLDYFNMDRIIIGYYSIACIFILIGRQFIGTVQSFITPYFSANDKNRQWVKKNSIRLQSFFPIIIIFLSIIIYVLVYMLIKFYYGPTYAVVLEFLPLLLFQIVIYSCYSILGPVLLAINKNRYNLYTAILKLIIKGATIYIMLSWYGIFGLLIAQALIEVIIALMEIFYFNIAMENK